MRASPRSERRPGLLALVAASLLVPLLSPLPASAEGQAEEGPRVVVRVDRPRPAADDWVNVTFAFEGIGTLSGIRPPAALPLKNLQLAGGPFQQTSVSIVNGDVRKQVSLTWRLRPVGPGPAEIGETQWFVGDKAVKGAATSLEVGPPRRGAGGGPGAVAPEDDMDPFSQLFAHPRPGPGSRPAPAAREGFVSYTVTPDKTTAWVGEEILLTYDLVVSAVDVMNLEFVDPPKFPGFWAEDVEKPEKPQGRPDTVDGRKVVRFLLLRKAVAGLAPGSFTIPAAKVRLAVRVSADPFADPFSMVRPQVVDRETPPLSVKILAIPGRPDFKGPVGRFDLAASVDRDRVAAGEAFTLKVKASGTGSLRTASEAPKLEIPGARVYPPTTKGASSRPSARTAAAEWDYVVVPSAAGALSVPAVGIEVFDTAEKRVVTRSTKPLTVRVEPAAPGASPSASAAAAVSATPEAPTTLPASELPAGAAGAAAASGAASTLRAGRGSGPAPSPSPSVDLAHGTVTLPFWALGAAAGLLVLGGGGALVLRRRGRSRASLAHALEPEPGETKERVASRIDRALRETVAGLGVSDGASAGRIVEELAAAGLDASTVDDVRRLLEDLDFLRFAPQLGEYGERIEDVRSAASRLLPRLRLAAERRPRAI